MKRVLFFLLILLMPTLVHALQVEPAAYDFGTVSVGETVIREFRLSNRDDDDLRLFSISLADDPVFRIAESTCGDRLKEKGSCRVRVEFAPLAVGSWATDLVIVSDGGDQPETIVHLQGTGRAVTTEPPTTEPPTTEPPTTEPPTTEPPTTEPPTTGTPGGDPPALAGILIRDSVEPYDDRTIPFDTVPVGVAKRKIFQIGNRNEAEMEILLLTPPSAPFSIENDGCSGAKLDFMDSCSVEVVFTPVAIGDQASDLTFSSTAPGENLISIAFSGSGIAQTDDFPAPVLIHPDNGSTNMKDEVTFRWSNCRDATGKLANYRLHAGPQPILPEMPIRRVLSTEASLGFALGGLYFLFRNGRRGRQWRWVSLALLAILLITACSEDIEDSSIEEVGNLADESTYYWQVVAEYDDGIEAKSEIRSFTTR
jgi:hypothetical protein